MSWLKAKGRLTDDEGHAPHPEFIRDHETVLRGIWKAAFFDGMVAGRKTLKAIQEGK